MKKIVSLLLAAVLVFSCMALGEQTSNVAYLFDEARELLLDTHNVTLALDADFTLDGFPFKQIDLDYKQDAVRSYLSYLVSSVPCEGADAVQSGYTVLGTGATAYSNLIGKGNYYTSTGTKVSDTLLLNTPKMALTADLARTVAILAEGMLSVNEKEGNTYRLASGELPEFINGTAYYLLAEYIHNRYWKDIFHEAQQYETVEVRYEGSWNDCVLARFEQLYGRPAENYYEDANEYNRWQVAENAVNQSESYIRTLYGNGFAVLRKDGSFEWYPTIEECYRALGEVEFGYENESKAFRDYYKMKTGEELSEFDFEVIMSSPSEKLWEAVAAMENEMRAYYLDKVRETDPLAVSALLKEDGTLKVFRSFTSGQNVKTVTETVVENIKTAGLTGMELTAQADESGKLQAGSGKLNFDLTYLDGSVHKLTVNFSAAVSDRGTTSVPAEFKPEDWGLVSPEEYYGAQAADEGYSDNWWYDLLEKAPDTIRFNGEEYDTDYYMYR